MTSGVEKAGNGDPWERRPGIVWTTHDVTYADFKRCR